MIVSVVSDKGGVGKTMTAVHLAAYLQGLAPTLLLDGDDVHNAIAWSKCGEGFPYKVAPFEQAAKLAANYKHIVIDVGQRPGSAGLEAAADGCDLLVVPTTLGGQATNGLGQTVRALQAIGADFRVLLAAVPQYKAKEAAALRNLLTESHAPVFDGEIPRLEVFQKAETAGCIVSQVKDPAADRAWESYVKIGRQLTSMGILYAPAVKDTAVRA